MSAQPQPPGSAQATVRNPASGEVIGQYPEQTAGAVRAAIQQARGRQSAWAGTPLAECQRCICRMRKILSAKTGDIAQLISDCGGKTRVEALATEVIPSVIGSRWYEKHATKFLQSRHLRNGSVPFFSKRSTLYRLPWGWWASSRLKLSFRHSHARDCAGAVMVNDHLLSHGLTETLRGGFGDSAIGRVRL